MLSVGNRDGRKGLGFVREMDDTELEEGEACSYRHDDQTVDPDIALAYLDEKLQNVLGHFQKDFEGGVSAENLGAKFGGYGSFLPTYQRSPVCSHTRTSKVENHGLRPPNNLQPEGAFNNNTMALNASQPAHCSDISRTRTLSATKSSTTRALKLEAGLEHEQAEELTSRSKTSKTSAVPDQKKLRVRIRVGSDNLSTQTKAELYSGLGLVASPSSSFEDNPESEGWYRKPHDAADESPNSIIHTMTSFPLGGSSVLSPLNEDLAYLSGNKKSLKGRPESTSESEVRESLNLSNGVPASGTYGKSLVPKKKKSSTTSGIPLEIGNGCTNTKNVDDIINKIPKEAGIGTLYCNKMISEALKLPLLSTSDGTASDFPQSSAKTSEVIMEANKATLSFQSCKVRVSDMNRDDVWAVEKPTSEVGSISNLSEHDTENPICDTDTLLKKPLVRKDDLNSSKLVKSVEKEQINYTLKTDLKEGYQVSEILSAAKDHSSFKAKSKLKAAIGHDIATKAVKAKAGDGSSSRSVHDRRKSQVFMHVAENSKLHNDVRKSRDAYNDIFGDQKSEHEEKERQSLDFSPGRGPKESQLTADGKITFKNKMKEEATSGISDKPIVLESYFKGGSYTAPLGKNEVSDEAAPAAPVLIEDHWVCCDNCQKWRLLPVGKLPETLPENWLCSMLDWLPGMNHCDIEEDETTKALVSFYQASAPESSKSTLGHVDGSTYTPLPSACSLGSTDLAGRTKSIQSAVKSRNVNDVNYSPAVPKLGNSHHKQSSDLGVKKNKKTTKLRLLERSSDEGDMENIKIDKKKRAGQDFSRASKKNKNGYLTDEGKLSQNDLAALKNQGPSASSVSPFLVTSKNHIAEEIHHSKISMQSKDKVSRSVDRPIKKRNGSPKDSSNIKRIAKSSQKSRYSVSLPSASIIDEERKRSLEVSSQRFANKEKKARLTSHLFDSNRENVTEGGDLVVAKNLKLTQDPDGLFLKGSMEDLEPTRRDLAPTHPVIVATSSSSKISSSRKSNAILQDIKSSPVESVTSSPLRSRRNDRNVSHGRHMFDKDCPPNGFGHSLSPRRGSNPEHEVGDRSGSAGLISMDNGRMGEDSVFPYGSKSDGKSVTCETLLNNKTATKVAITVGKYSDEACISSHSLLNVSLPDQKGSFMRSRDRIRKSKSGSDKRDASNLFSGSQDQTNTHVKKLMGDKHIVTTPQKLEKKRDMKIQGENGSDGARVKSSNNYLQDEKYNVFPSSSASQKVLVEELETNLLSGKSDARSQFVGGISTGNDLTCDISGSHRQNEMGKTSADAFRGDGSLKELKTSRNANNQNGVLPTTLRHPTASGQASKDLCVPSHARRDSSTQSAANAVKEAKSLKHVADRMKSSGSYAESIGLYFQAALKFLLGASLLESSTSDTRHGDMIQSTQVYSSTAKLCEFCAREFEKAQDMASAALAYKCTEVAYMRVVYSSHSNANRDRHELQTALQMAPPGDSPSSSASDIDNMNNAANDGKIPLAKDVSSPQLTGSHVISARSRPSFSRLLNFTQDVSFAMEASRKSRSTLAATTAYLEKLQNEEGIRLIKRALDYNFQDVEGLLQLVRLGVEAISRMLISRGEDDWRSSWDILQNEAALRLRRDNIHPVHKISTIFIPNPRHSLRKISDHNSRSSLCSVQVYRSSLALA